MFIADNSVWMIRDGTTDPVRVDEHSFEVCMQDRVVFRRRILPLIAWAVTIHKTQGLGFDQLAIDLGCCFARGQAYTALSRVRSHKGLFLLRFNKMSIRASPRAVNFDRSLMI